MAISLALVLLLSLHKRELARPAGVLFVVEYGPTKTSYSSRWETPIVDYSPKGRWPYDHHGCFRALGISQQFNAPLAPTADCYSLWLWCPTSVW